MSDGFFADAQDVFLHGLTGTNHQGTCSSLPVLYVATGRRLGYPLKLVTTKGHLFVRWEDARERFNFEAAGNGANRFPDEYYRHWPLEVSESEGQIWVIPTGELVKKLSEIRQMCQNFRERIMYYADLSPYEYYREIEGSSELADCERHLNVGWLDSRFAFPTGDVPTGFLEKLFSLCLKPAAKTRGFHVCDLCQNPKHFEMPKVQRNGVVCFLGNGEIRVRSSEFVYVAPTLIYHYVSEHSYLPPSAFIEAVLLT